MPVERPVPSVSLTDEQLATLFAGERLVIPAALHQQVVDEARSLKDAASRLRAWVGSPFPAKAGLR